MLLREEKADLHIPVTCDKCGSKLIYKGIGEYACENCGELFYDDYGKVRNYLEAHPGATAYEVEDGTGVRRDAISRLLREERIDVTPYTRK